MSDEIDQLLDAGAITLHEPTQVRQFSEVFSDIVNTKRNKRARFNDVGYMRRLNECVAFLRMVKNGEIGQTQLLETLSTSDFPILFGDVLDTRLLNQYGETKPTWAQYFQRGTVQDFRASRLIAIDGLSQPLYPSSKKAELESVTYDNDIDETAYTTQVEVYERGVSYNWRMLINRRGDFLNRIPQLLARAARRTENKFAVDLFVDATGPNATFFSLTNKNTVVVANGSASANPPLSVQGLRDALNVMYRQLDPGGDPIEIEGVTLVVPPALRITAMEILNAVQLELVPATSAAGTRFTTPPWVGDLRLAVDWYLPIIDVSANKHTTWYLFAEPNLNRPAGEITFLSGYEQPSLWQKAPNTQRVGGGIDPIMGDFQDMSIHQKILHVIGGVLIDPKAAVVSNGSGV